MKKIESKFIILIIGFILLGIMLDFSASCISLGTKQFIYMDSQGNQKTTTIIDEPVSRKLINIGSVISFSLAFSIFISVFISRKIEENQMKTQVDEMKKLKENLYIDVHDALFEKIIPKEIFQVIKKEIINQDVIRRDAEWILDFSLNPENNEHIDLRFTCRYKAYNNCDKIIKNPITRVNCNRCDSKTYIEKVICTLHDEIIVQYDKDDVTKNSGVTIEDIDDNSQRINYDLEIPPKHFVEYTTVFTTRYGEAVQDEFFTVLPQIDVSITATYPEEYKFKIFPILSQDLKLKLQEKKRSIYKAEGGILPNQGIVFYLEKNT